MPTPKATTAPTSQAAPTSQTSQTSQSKMHRLQLEDQVSYIDNSEWPPVSYQGTITGFANDENTYLEIELTHDAAGEPLPTPITKTLTEDEVTRVG